MENDDDSDQECDPRELLLYAARNGDVSVVKKLLEDRRSGTIELDISCKGLYFPQYWSKFIYSRVF